jgi:hypothetical protein
MVHFRSINQLENAPVENFQDIEFDDLKQQQTGFEGNYP